MILLDTSVLVYAVGNEHPLRDPCRRVLSAQRDGAIDAAVTVEILQEFTHARARRHPRADAVAVARDYAASLRVLQATAADLDRGLDIFVAHPDLPKKVGFRPAGDVRRYYEPAVAALAETSAPFEINTAGWRKDCREQYPAREFLDLAHTAGIPLLINSDAHAVAERYRFFSYGDAMLLQRS